MQYSPKLKKAMTEIKAIAEKYDIAAIVCLHTPGHGEYLLKVDPSYSCAKFDPVTSELRIRALLVQDFKGNKEAWATKITDTANMLQSFLGTGNLLLDGVVNSIQMLGKHVEMSHREDGHSTDQQQNN